MDGDRAKLPVSAEAVRSVPPNPTLETLYGVHRREVLRFLTARTGDRAEADDLLQELWIRARAHAGPVGDGRSYLYRMAHNLIVDRLRAQQRRMRRDRRWSDERHGDDAGLIDRADPAPTPEEALIAREEGQVVRAAIATLPERARRAFELHKLRGMSHAEVARDLSISISAVEKHMSVAMKHLRRILLD